MVQKCTQSELLTSDVFLTAFNLLFLIYKFAEDINFQIRRTLEELRNEDIQKLGVINFGFCSESLIGQISFELE